jgi:hypothetical protein
VAKGRDSRGVPEGRGVCLEGGGRISFKERRIFPKNYNYKKIIIKEYNLE